MQIVQDAIGDQAHAAGPSPRLQARRGCTMSEPAGAPQAGPAGREHDVFPLRERLRFRDNFGLGLRDVRQRPIFSSLERGPWQVFIAIACHWQANAEAWPSQEKIAQFSGYSSRAVRDYVDVLERGGLLRLRRERQANGADRIYYAPGAVTLTELASFVERFPKGPAKVPSSNNPPEASSGTPPEVAAAAPPEATSMEHRDQDQEPSSFGESAAARSREREEEQPSVTKEDRELARIALAERMKRKHPKRPPPRWFDRGDVEFVAACAAAVDGDRATKLQALRDSILGAFGVSKDGAPTSRFIWGKLEHFLEHVESGRRRRVAEERNARSREEAVANPSPRATSPPIPPANMSADLERIFGPDRRATNVPR